MKDQEITLNGSLVKIVNNVIFHSSEIKVAHTNLIKSAVTHLDQNPHIHVIHLNGGQLEVRRAEPSTLEMLDNLSIFK
jgi:hypothetical protein